jgi:hypothetical protein
VYHLYGTLAESTKYDHNMGKPLVKKRAYVVHEEICYVYVLCQNYWVFGPCLLSIILKARKHSPQVIGETPTLLGSLENANLNYQSNQVGVWPFT